MKFNLNLMHERETWREAYAVACAWALPISWFVLAIFIWVFPR